MLGRQRSRVHGMIFKAQRHLPMTRRLSSVCFRGDIVVSSCVDPGSHYGRRWLLKFLLASYRARDNTFKTIHTAGRRDRHIGNTRRKKAPGKILGMKQDEIEGLSHHGLIVSRSLSCKYTLIKRQGDCINRIALF